MCVRARVNFFFQFYNYFMCLAVCLCGICICYANFFLFCIAHLSACLHICCPIIHSFDSNFEWKVKWTILYLKKRSVICLLTRVYLQNRNHAKISRLEHLSGENNWIVHFYCLFTKSFLSFFIFHFSLLLLLYNRSTFSITFFVWCLAFSENQFSILSFVLCHIACRWTVALTIIIIRAAF